MPQINAVHVDARRSLIERVAASRHVNRSARLRDLLLYVSERVLEGQAGEIHEQELGHQVFGRPKNYDTTADNIVRVHASMLRKRLEQYFAEEGADETLEVVIPKGNYAPVFRVRAELPPVAPAPAEQTVTPLPPVADGRLRILAASTLILACSTIFLMLRAPDSAKDRPARSSPVFSMFWSTVFPAGAATDIVLDDAGVGLYQELTGRPLPLADYFDRGYLRNLAGTKLDESTASSIVLRRQSSFADTNFLWKLMTMPGAQKRQGTLRFAREYSFRELKSRNAILLGNSRSNPWMEPFEAKLGLRWTYDKEAGVYYPVDTWDGNKSYRAGLAGDAHEGYCAISLVPNIGGSGMVLLVTGTGGSAVSAGADFLADEESLSALRKHLAGSGSKFPPFEALIKVRGRSGSPRDATIVFCRSPKA